MNRKKQLGLILTTSLLVLIVLSLQSFKNLSPEDNVLCHKLMMLNRLDYYPGMYGVSEEESDAFFYTHKLINTESKKVNTDSLISNEDLKPTNSAEAILKKY
ncbi:hypothetical protein GCM10022289_09990 [Pedobacter jeongneungensis]|uniref:Uncharacterized protein n=1 Tax=Pedobacter jeongneungensis TaxID=947309 RepID=A0ABP8B6T0_9SPHI